MNLHDPAHATWCALYAEPECNCGAPASATKRPGLDESFVAPALDAILRRNSPVEYELAQSEVARIRQAFHPGTARTLNLVEVLGGLLWEGHDRDRADVPK